MTSNLPLILRDFTTPTGGSMGLLGSGTSEQLLSRGPTLDTEVKDLLHPLPSDRLSMTTSRARRLVTTHSDDTDSAVSMSFDRSFEDHDTTKEYEFLPNF